MKILVIHATAGAGHKKAAEAIFHGLEAQGGHDVRLADALDYTNPLFKKTYPESYSFLVTRLPWAWGFFFALLDVPWMQPLVHMVRRLYNGFNAQALQKFLIQEQFDAVITTQFLSAEVCAYLKREGKIKSKIICVVTDFDVHRIWVNEGIDVYTGACEYTRNKLIALGVPQEKVFTTGIPTDAKFALGPDIIALKQKLGLQDGLLTILIATGSFGMGPIEELMKLLENYQLLIVCGHNRALYERLKPLANKNAHVLGLVNNMDELMAVSNVMVTKPGGLSIAEALVKKLPMIFFSAIPGQETNNIKVLSTYEVSQGQSSLPQIAQTINEWNSNPKDLDALRRRMSELSKPNAVADIIALARHTINMIAQVVFDLPLDGPFDYLIPEHLIPSIAVGTRVKVSFGPKPQIGFVIGLLEQSAVPKLKPIQSLCDDSPAFNSLDLIFARDFCVYYGCSLGEALGTMLRNRADHRASIHREHKPLFYLYRCAPDLYAARIQEIINGYPEHARFLILVPDAFRSQMLSKQLNGAGSIKIGTRSSVFECDGQYDCVIMVDEEDPSYKQEQMPMYDTRQVLLTRSKIYGFDITFVGIAPSVELMAWVREGKVKSGEDQTASLPRARVVDLSNYKFVPGLISPPVRDGIEAALKASKKSILVLNRRGSYRLTRCVDCAEILKCSHCDSSLIYSRSAGKFLCRHCTYTAPGDTVCLKCHKSSWRSVGIGVEQVQTELKKLFPQARITAFERPAKSEVKQSLPEFDILISTSAVLRFQGTLKAQLAAFIDFDAELNRLDMRCGFNAFSLAVHIGSMAQEPVFIQTRNSDHYVLQGLSSGKIQDFYDEELKLRKEFGFSPFKHWVRISWRGKSEKTTQECAQEVYNALSRSASAEYAVTPPLADAVGRKRDQFRFNVMVQSAQVPQTVAFIKSALAKSKRRSKVIVTMNVDP